MSEIGGDRVQIRFRGLFWADLRDIESEVARRDNMEYGGPFRNPEDLPEIYAGIDLAWIAHYDLPANIMWARATRFYSAGYFGIPMVAQLGTEDGREVAALGIGPIVDLADPEDAAKRILAVTHDDVARWREALRSVPHERFVYTDEHVKLLADLEAALSRRKANLG